MLARIERMIELYGSDIVPPLNEPIDLRLFNTLRSYMFPDFYPRRLQLHSDARGSLFEAVRSLREGQTFLSTTRPGMTRGEHYHLQKIERFLVISGEAVIRLRRLLQDEIFEFRVSGEAPSFIDMPTLFTHNITNVGETELVTLFWSHTIFDPTEPDQYPMAVQPEGRS